ncbi:hypothetical protein [Palaeococcus ferrophilus]|uniref:hypothetical protein n=1 Tax=Palaeococcus ferrophilus TaxID=83868 RepID=UPI00064F1310|nr:hypothetical protein [Palaeococcus ferrophilus]
MEAKKLALGMLFVVFLMIFTSHAGIVTGDFWNDPIRGILKGLFMGFSVLVIPFIVTASLIKRTSLYAAIFAAASVELLLAVTMVVLGHMQYSRVLLEAVVIGLPGGILIAWVASQNKF